MWETLTFLQNYRAVTEIIFKSFKKKQLFCIFWMSVSLFIVFLTFPYIYHGIYPKFKDTFLFNDSLCFPGLFHKKPSCITAVSLSSFLKISCSVLIVWMSYRVYIIDTNWFWTRNSMPMTIWLYIIMKTFYFT